MTMTRIEHPLNAARLHNGVWLSEPVTAVYDTAHPFEIRFRFHDGIEWTFARDLLAQGLIEPAGDRIHGDVLFLPLEGAIEVALNSPHGSMTLIFRPRDLHAFLSATTGLVPLGAERIDWDRELDTLGGTR